MHAWRERESRRSWLQLKNLQNESRWSHFLLESKQQHKAIDIADRSTSSASIIKVAWRWCFIVFTFFPCPTMTAMCDFLWENSVYLELTEAALLHDTKTLVQWPWLELTLLHLMLELASTCEWAKKDDGKENESSKQTSWPIYFSVPAQQSSHAFATRTTPRTPHPLLSLYTMCLDRELKCSIDELWMTCQNGEHT